MKNKKMLLFAGVLAAFLMLAVPFAVVSFNSDDVSAEPVFDETGDVLQIRCFDDDGELTESRNLSMWQISNGTFYSYIAEANCADIEIVLLKNIRVNTGSENSGYLYIKSNNGVNVTFDGNGKVIKVTGGSNNVILFHYVDNGTIKNLTIDGDGKGRSGLNLMSSTVAINNVEIKDCAGAAVVVNDSNVTFKDISTSGNIWGHALNVGKADSTKNFGLTFEGECNFSEPYAVKYDGGTYLTLTFADKSNVGSKFNILSASADLKTNVINAVDDSSKNFDLSITASGLGRLEIPDLTNIEKVIVSSSTEDVLSGIKITASKTTTDVEVKNVKSDAGINIFGGKSVNIVGCEVTGFTYLGQIGPVAAKGLITVSSAGSVGIENCKLTGKGDSDDALQGIIIYDVSGSVSISGDKYENAFVKDVEYNSIWIQKAGAVSINGISISNWNYGKESTGGRAIKVDSVASISVTGCEFSESFVDGAFDDVGELLKATSVTADGRVIFNTNKFGTNNILISVNESAKDGYGYLVDYGSVFTSNSDSTSPYSTGYYFFEKVEFQNGVSFPNNASTAEVKIYGTFTSAGTIGGSGKTVTLNLVPNEDSELNGKIILNGGSVTATIVGGDAEVSVADLTPADGKTLSITCGSLIFGGSIGLGSIVANSGEETVYLEPGTIIGNVDGDDSDNDIDGVTIFGANFKNFIVAGTASNEDDGLVISKDSSGNVSIDGNVAAGTVTSSQTQNVTVTAGSEIGSTSAVTIDNVGFNNVSIGEVPLVITASGEMKGEITEGTVAVPNDIRKITAVFDAGVVLTNNTDTIVFDEKSGVDIDGSNHFVIVDIFTLEIRVNIDGEEITVGELPVVAGTTYADIILAIGTPMPEDCKFLGWYNAAGGLINIADDIPAVDGSYIVAVYETVEVPKEPFVPKEPYRPVQKESSIWDSPDMQVLLGCFLLVVALLGLAVAIRKMKQ